MKKTQQWYHVVLGIFFIILAFYSMGKSTKDAYKVKEVYCESQGGFLFGDKNVQGCFKKGSRIPLQR